MIKKNLIYLIILVVILLSGCNSVKGPSVSEEQAIQIAKSNYSIESVEKLELRNLTEQELRLAPKDAQQKTPVYYVIQGENNEKKQLVIFVSSNDINTFFIKHNDFLLNHNRRISYSHFFPILIEVTCGISNTLTFPFNFRLDLYHPNLNWTVKCCL